MNTHANKSQEKKSQSAINSVSQKKTNAESTFQFVDNRPLAVVQCKLQEMVNNSLQVQQATQQQTLADNYVVRQQQPIQRAIIVDETRLSQYTYKPHFRDGGKFAENWAQTSEDMQERIMQSISERETLPPYNSWGDLMRSLGGGGEVEIPEVETPWQEIQWGFATLNIRILSEEGGYHLIWEVAELPNHIVRAPKEGATPIRLGIENWGTLNRRLQGYQLARVPEIMNVETAEANDAYIVERITKTVDALDMWEMLNSTDNEILRQLCNARLRTIAEMFQQNIADMLNQRPETFPDFRPSNVGLKDEDPSLIYIDFDQPQVQQEAETLKAHAMEWAGRRFIRDAGGAREPNVKLWNFITGGMIGGMEEAIQSY
jgi:hypothetical protein